MTPRPWAWRSRGVGAYRPRGFDTCHNDNGSPRFLAFEDEVLNAAQGVMAPGREFHFMRAIRFSVPAGYAADDYAGFIECLRNVGASSLYLHVFEARLRPPYGVDDFSHWFRLNFNDETVGREISRLDPYSYTLEGLRHRIIRIMEKRLAEVSRA